MFYKIYEIIYSEILLNKITSPFDATWRLPLTRRAFCRPLVFAEAWCPWNCGVEFLQKRSPFRPRRFSSARAHSIAKTPGMSRSSIPTTCCDPIGAKPLRLLWHLSPVCLPHLPIGSRIRFLSPICLPHLPIVSRIRFFLEGLPLLQSCNRFLELLHFEIPPINRIGVHALSLRQGVQRNFNPIPSVSVSHANNVRERREVLTLGGEKDETTKDDKRSEVKSQFSKQVWQSRLSIQESVQIRETPSKR